MKLFEIRDTAHREKMFTNVGNSTWGFLSHSVAYKFPRARFQITGAECLKNDEGINRLKMIELIEENRLRVSGS